MPPMEWAVGESCQAKDAGAWYASKIVAERVHASGGKEYKVHFVGWAKRYDRWMSPDTEVLLPSDAITEQPKSTPELESTPMKSKQKQKQKQKQKEKEKQRSDSRTSTAKRGKPGKKSRAASSTGLGAEQLPSTIATVTLSSTTPKKTVKPATATKPRADGKIRKTAQPVRRALKSKSHAQLENVDFGKVTQAELCFDVLSVEELRPLLAALGRPTTGVNRIDLVDRLRDAVSQGIARATASTDDGDATRGASMQVSDFRRASNVASQNHRYRSKPNAKPDDIQEPLQDPTYESIAAALESINVPVNVSRTNVKVSDDQVVTGMCIGVVGGRAHGIITSKYARQRPHLTESLVRFAKKFAPNFHFTSIQVNKNYMSAMHVDKNNLGPSYIVGVGDYKDGALWVQPKGDVDCRHKWVLFDGNIPHCTLPYTGTRYTLIYFAQQSFRLLGHIGNNRSHKAILLKLGFPFPPKSSRKKQYEPWKLRLLQAKAAFRKWEDCKAKGIEYSWDNKERLKWRHESDEVDLSLNVKNDDGWGPDDSDSEDEPDSWAVRGRRPDQLFAGAPVPSSLIRKLGRTGGVSVLAQYFIRRARGQNFNLRERPVGATYIDRASDDEAGWSDMENNFYVGPRASRSESSGVERRGKRRISEKEWMEGIVAQQHFGHCVTESDEPSMQDVAKHLGVRVQHLVGLNKVWYPRLSYFAKLVKGTMLMIPDTPGAVRGCVPLNPAWSESTEDAYAPGEKWWGMQKCKKVALGQDPEDTPPVEARRWVRRMYRTGGLQILHVREEEVAAVSALLTQANSTVSAVHAACLADNKVEGGAKRQRKRKISQVAEGKRSAKRVRREERKSAMIRREVAGVLKRLVKAVHKKDAADTKAAKVAERLAKRKLREQIARAPLVYKKNMSPLAYKRALLMDAPELMRGCRPYIPPRPPEPIDYKRSLLQDAAGSLWRGCSIRPRIYEHNKRKHEKGEPCGPVSAYRFFCTAVKRTLIEEQPSLLPAEYSKALSERWKALSSESRERYYEMHRADQARYRREIVAWDHPLARAARHAAAEAARVAAEEAWKEQKRAAEERAVEIQAKKEERKRAAAEKAAAIQAKKAERERAAAEKVAAMLAKKEERERAAAEKAAAMQAKKEERERAVAEKAKERQRAAAKKAAAMQAKKEERERVAAGKAAAKLAKIEEGRERSTAEKATRLATKSSGGARKRRKKQPGEPMGYRSAFIFFSADSKVHAAIMKDMTKQPQGKQCGSMAGIGLLERTKLVSERWQALTARQKATWQKKAQADKQRYCREMAEWQAKRGGIRDSDSGSEAKSAWT